MSVQSAHYLTCTNRPGQYPESTYPPSPWQSPQGLALLGLISPSEPHQPNSGSSASARPLHPLRQLINSCMWPARHPHDHELRSDACWTSFIRPQLHLAGARVADPTTNAARSNCAGDSPSWRTMRVLRGLRLRVHASGNRAHARRLVSPPFPFELECGSCLGGALGSASPGRLALYRLLSW
jgi:hypothetical protein